MGSIYATRLRAAGKAVGLDSINAIARKADIDQPGLNKVANGEQYLSPENEQKLAAALGIDVGVIYSWRIEEAAANSLPAATLALLVSRLASRIAGQTDEPGEGVARHPVRPRPRR